MYFIIGTFKINLDLVKIVHYC